MIRLIEFLPARPHPLWRLCAQIGVNGAVVKVAPELTGLGDPAQPGVLQRIAEELRDAGIELIGLEGDPFDMSGIKLGLDDRERQIARYVELLERMSECGLKLLCYNFMVGVGWYRSGETAGRGGARCTRFCAADAPASTVLGPVEPGRVWDAYAHFIERVMPEARRRGIRMALHPDDPPLPSLSGIARIFGSISAFDRA
ncbi:MAG TPA: mannonate dehydratase, partial [Tepidisphaeraceae bacterium]|nr:mannonate dehydratase [Tepidisphaeraceae bacterium]